MNDAASRASPAGVPVPARVALLLLGGVALVTGVLAGLARFGFAVPAAGAANAALHGPLMIGGFFGVVISLERAVALGRTWAYAAPLLAGASTLATLAGVPNAPWLLALASVVLFAATASVFRRQPALFTLTLLAGAAAWLAGNLLWALGSAPHASVWWWMAFLVLTIAGERLELSRFLPPSVTAERVFALIVGLIVFALVFLEQSPYAIRALGLGWLALAAWLAKQDVARRTIRASGLTRYVAVCLVSGYVWLAVGGAALLLGDVQPGGATRDFALHALALGFVFAMVFGHGPIIVPAVLRVTVPWHPAFYAPLALLHAALLLRLSGDVAGSWPLARFGGIANAVALVAFIATMLAAALRGRRATSRGKPA